MTAHEEFLELVSASMDFDLTEDERGRLNLHLSECPACRRAGVELRAVAAEVAAVPQPRLSPTRSEAILAAALRRPASRPRWGLLAVAAALLAVGGGAAAALGLFDDDPAPSVPPSQTPIAEVSAPPSAGPIAPPSERPGDPVRPTPAVTPTPGTVATATPQGGRLAFPLPWSEDIGPIRLAPTADGRLWVSIGRDADTVLALLDTDGDPAAGWPIEVDAFDCVPYALGDASVRLACATSEVDPDTCVDSCFDDQLFAWDASANPVPGWPVSLGVSAERQFLRDSGRVIGTDLLLVESVGDGETDPEFGLVRFQADGTVMGGAPVAGLDWCCRIAPSGVAFGRSVLEQDDGPSTTSIVAFRETAILPGWPIEVAGEASMPSIGPDGRMYLSTWINGVPELVVLGADGSLLGRTAIPGDVGPDPRTAGPMRPLVDATGRAFLLVDDGALAFDRDGLLLAGWPYESRTALEADIACDLGEGDTGCESWPLPPALDPAGVLYIMETSEGSKGGRLTALDPDGSVVDGWPLVLQRSGARFGSVVVAETDGVFAVAFEPEPGEQTSITILAVESDKTRRWGTTIIEP